MDYRMVMQSVVQDKRLAFMSAPSQENAALYVTAVDLSMQIADLEFEQSARYLDVLDDAMANKVAAVFDWGSDNSSRTASIKATRAFYKSQHEMATAMTDQIGLGLQHGAGSSAAEPIAFSSQADFDDDILPILQELKAMREEWCRYVDLTGSGRLTIRANDVHLGSLRLSQWNGALDIDDGASLFCGGDFSALKLWMESDASMRVGGDAVIPEMDRMLDGSVLHICGSFTVGNGNYDDYTTTNGIDLKAGVVEVEGDMTLSGNHGYGASGSHVTVFCGTKPQNVISQMYFGWHHRLGSIASRNPHTVISRLSWVSPGCLAFTLAEDSVFESVHAGSVNANGHLLDVSNELRLSRGMDLPGGSVLRAKCLTLEQGFWGIDAKSSTISIADSRPFAVSSG